MVRSRRPPRGSPPTWRACLRSCARSELPIARRCGPATSTNWRAPSPGGSGTGKASRRGTLEGVDGVTWTRQADLDRPVLIAAFRGWNDGGEAASTAAAYLRDRWGAQPLADIDPDGFLDFQMTRPTVRLEAGITRRIEWPELRFSTARVDGRDVVVFLGVEPNVQWRAFAETFLATAREIGVGEVVTLGAFLADVPHTRPTPVTGLAVDPERSQELGLTSSRYEGPTGIVGVGSRPSLPPGRTEPQGCARPGAEDRRADRSAGHDGHARTSSRLLGGAGHLVDRRQRRADGLRPQAGGAGRRAGGAVGDPQRGCSRR